MGPILKKMGFQEQSPLLILNAPGEFQVIQSEIKTEVHTSFKTQYSFMIVFVKSLRECDELAEKSVSSLDGDGYLWICYPKSSSKRYKSDLNRDKARAVFAPFSFEGVSIIAIDEDWSALRLRHTNYIKKITGKGALSEKGKELAKKKQ